MVASPVGLWTVLRGLDAAYQCPTIGPDLCVAQSLTQILAYLQQPGSWQ